MTNTNHSWVCCWCPVTGFFLLPEYRSMNVLFSVCSEVCVLVQWSQGSLCRTVYYFELIPQFLWQDVACFYTVHKPDSSVDYTLFDYVIFPYQSFTLHKNKVYSWCFVRHEGLLASPAAVERLGFWLTLDLDDCKRWSTMFNQSLLITSLWLS